MPISIFDNNKSERLAWLCDDDWGLASQIDELEKWLIENSEKIPNGNYTADIGYRGNKEAKGGGGVVTLNLMERAFKSGMEIFLSEYPY